jgi:hypothetical protein
VRLITLTTDFGASDWFVGTMKGVILSINPRTSIVDITHEIPAGDIRAAAFALAASFQYFPKKTVHVAVVDPGVGSRRKAIAVRTANYLFVGPDNGVLSFALAREKIQSIRLLTNEKMFLPVVSQTFHGRDVFAPVAARLSRGLQIEKLGPPAAKYMKLEWPASRRRGGSVEGEVVYIDRFGNAITNIDPDSLAANGALRARVVSFGRQLCPLKSSYHAVPTGKPVAVFGSSGFLELAVNGRSAARMLGLRVGERVSVRRQQTQRTQ